MASQQPVRLSCRLALSCLLFFAGWFEVCGTFKGGGSGVDWHAPVNDSLKQQYREEVRRMFIFGYDNYMEHAFPLDELNPHACSGRGVCAVA